MSLNDVKTVVVNIYDPGQDAKIPVLRVPTGHVYTVEALYALTDRAVAAHADNHFTLTPLNGGTDGAGTAEVGAAIGGTPGWAANTPKSSAITAGSGDLTAGQYLLASYNEEGTIAPGNITIVVEYVDGIGSKA